MSELSTIPPTRRLDLIIRPFGEHGGHVVKDPVHGGFFRLGVQESFLLLQLDGRRNAEEICREFEERFGEPLSAEELDEFLALARDRNLLASEEPFSTSASQQGLSSKSSGEAEANRARRDAPPAPQPLDERNRTDAEQREESAPQRSNVPKSRTAAAGRTGRQSLFYWRKSLFNPDRLLSWLAPRLWFCWTPAFLFLTVLLIVAAAGVALTQQAALVSFFPHILRWETIAAVWITLFLVTMAHEFAHGLTCKRYGGQVPEIGFLLMFLMPAFYCNVSDAWLIREKSKRLWVTFAGGYLDLCLWSLAVFAWRLTPQASLPNYLAWVVLSVTGLRVFFNFNPFLKLDGYYLLIDLLEIPNLRQRALERFHGEIRWLLWGASRPRPERHARFLFFFGLASWGFSVGLLTFLFVLFGKMLQSWVGAFGAVVATLLALIVLRGLFTGFAAGENGWRKPSAGRNSPRANWIRAGSPWRRIWSAWNCSSPASRRRSSRPENRCGEQRDSSPVKRSAPNSMTRLN